MSHFEFFPPVCPLFVPGHLPRMRDKAVALDLGAVIVDLEDAVPAQAKAAARDGARDLSVRLAGRCWARINPLATRSFGTACGADDITAVIGAGLVGVVVPKVESADEMAEVDRLISGAERAAGLACGTIAVTATIETAEAMMSLREISRAVTDRPFQLAFGMGDFTVDLDVAWTRDEEESALARAMVPIASRAAKLAKPVDSVFVDLSDMDGLRSSAERGKRLGYGGKVAIHPAQIEIIMSVYAPDQEEVERATRIIFEAERQKAAGVGAFLIDGRMIDEPIVERARAVLAAAGQVSMTKPAPAGAEGN